MRCDARKIAAADIKKSISINGWHAKDSWKDHLIYVVEFTLILIPYIEEIKILIIFNNCPCLKNL